ncbi:protein-disulfide reductase DsbD family protein [Hephaestia sp. GCM10023244]|uniref:protein-disulfide reductase DsbD family protein n=1 Tax=unclassified Hephaestia TaxID=2631281 RepID=UPI0020772767|nr:protein-disulfide reductase DsbD domain-containing protein [Hephaestia sp. MAHUQ-44]MCM8731744.1 thioredoxin family protein [Hephaestia sp. MAHUQ-44]
MHAVRFWLVTWLALLLGVTAAHAQLAPDPSGPHLAMQLVAETTTPAAGSEVTLAIDARPQPGWHGYWQNPGDAGFPARLDWTLPAGVTASAPVYPMPQTLLIAGLMNHVFEKPYAALVTLSIPAALAPGTALQIGLHTNYLVCTDQICVPEAADLATNLTIGDGAIDPGVRARFDGWRQAIPKPIGSPATYQVAEGRVRIAVPYPATAPLGDAHFFAITPDVVAYAAPQRVSRDGDRVVIETKASGDARAESLEGVLRIGPDRGLSLTATAGMVASVDAGAGGVNAALLAFLGAVLGGLILNIMPCVFPILSLKALSLARAGIDERHARREGVAYTAGVVLTCVALGAIILGLRAGGSAIGWAFQLQDPRMIVVLFVLALAIALNLAGVFQIPTPRFVNRAAGSGGAFLTGVLAAFVATPCTGPFMGAALGAALVLPTGAALAVFAGLGLGLALPFLLLGFVPALRRILPKPGAWMQTFERVLSVPMALTALALLWVLSRQAGNAGVVLGVIAALLLGGLLWLAGRRQARGLAGGVLAAVALVGVGAVGAAAVTRLPHQASVPVAGAEPFSEARLAALRDAGRPVFAYFTADWCLTCKVNEKVAIETGSVGDAFARHDVAVLVGDWTDGDPALGRFIQAHNRAGVPLYLYYAPGAVEPRVLPQVLTPAMLTGLVE